MQPASAQIGPNLKPELEAMGSEGCWSGQSVGLCARQIGVPACISMNQASPVALNTESPSIWERRQVLSGGTPNKRVLWKLLEVDPLPTPGLVP